ncbi:TetR/AcrR family transcriptional regulator [Streptomyces roseoverticillatus]|uniref:TetR/AcrR family transcriptional regulator n=1 Tax=Streptomyces roseoverticillatus TaxID=66429 RepID=UPI0027E4D2C1|nr:TetR/AcrR family transcriptional regulator [Streptomyces roseoverticillatus]
MAEALRLLDAEGLDVLSMRRLADPLGTAATSLYRHVANKDELIGLALDEVFAECLPAIDEQTPWREFVSECGHAVRMMILRHPWTTAVLGGVGMTYFGPNLMLLSEAMLGALEEAGFPLREAGSLMSMVFAYVIGMADTEAAWLANLARSGVTEEEWARRAWPPAERAIQPFPRLRRFYALHTEDGYGAESEAGSEGASAVLRRSRDEEFAYGLGCLLDGAAVHRSEGRCPRPESSSHHSGEHWGTAVGR